MNLKDFKAGYYKLQYKYKSFYPEKINHTWSWDDPVLNTLLEQAVQSLGDLNAFSLFVPEVDLFIRMHIVKEANTSSMIEGTRTEIDETLMNIEEIEPERRADWQEVQNYISAMNVAIDKLKTLPLSNRLLREVHTILLKGVRGEYKSALSDAVFIPPHHEDVPELMSDLEKFWHNDEIDVPHLIRIAISHYQFETIHPFLDGNGRIGRLLITLYLVNHKLLEKPSLYLSDFFEKHRPSYYDALSRVRESDDLVHWIKFFLNGVISTAEKGKDTFKSILLLRKRVDENMVKLGRRAKKGKALMKFLYRKPVVTAPEISESLSISTKSVYRLIHDLEKMGILKEKTGKRRNKIFVFDEYLKLFLD